MESNEIIMKRIISIIMAVLIAASFASFSVNAFESEDKALSDLHIVSVERTPTTDGGYIETIVYASEPVSLRGETNATSGSKEQIRYDANDNMIWKYTLNGLFTFRSGVSSSCLAANHSVENNDAWWIFSNGNSYASGNQAIGTGTFEYKILGLILTETVNINLTLTCDVYGNVT